MQDGWQKYSYEGPVLYFDRAVIHRWKGETIAPSEKKARSNLAYQAKKQLNLIASSNIKLPGTVRPVI